VTWCCGLNRKSANKVFNTDVEELTQVNKLLRFPATRICKLLVECRVGNARHKCDTDQAAQLLATAGENINRFHSEAAFARLCGVAPVPVSSGKNHRMRLHRGGDRKANRALHIIAVARLRYDARTIDYMQRRLSEGLSKKDVLRCLERVISREVFRDLTTGLGTT
jgi:hypothetical protein